MNERGAERGPDHQTPHGADDPCTTVYLPFGVRAPRAAREQMGAQLRTAEIRPTVVVDAELVMSELVSNGIEHGQPGKGDTIEVSWCVFDDRIRISVCDGGPRRELHAIEFTDDSLRGRGLAMVDALCSSWTVDGDDGIRITAELDYHLEDRSPAL